MLFSIHATLPDGTTLFRGRLNYVPRTGEEIEVNGFVFVVKKVRYTFKEGTHNETYISLLVERI
jgi:hypothetical protein